MQPVKRGHAGGGIVQVLVNQKKDAWKKMHAHWLVIAGVILDGLLRENGREVWLLLPY